MDNFTIERERGRERQRERETERETIQQEMNFFSESF